jgi:hypothetical protein
MLLIPIRVHQKYKRRIASEIPDTTSDELVETRTMWDGYFKPMHER